MNDIETGLLYEDFTTGVTYRTASRVIAPEDVQAFAALSGDQNPLHRDPVFMETHPLGRPIAHGMLVASIGTGLISGLGLSRGTLIAMLEQQILYKKPVFPGDTVHVVLKVIEKSETSNPNRGIITYRFEIRNQDDGLVVTGTQKNMMRTKASELTE